MLIVPREDVIRMPRRSGEVVSARLSNAICMIADDEATDAVDGFDDTVDDDDGSSHRRAQQAVGNAVASNGI